MTTLAALAAMQRAERAQLEADAASRLLTAYGQAWDAISRDLAALTRSIEAARRAGTPLTADWLRRERRYTALLSQIEAQITGLAARAGPLVRQQQTAAIAAAQRHAEELARAALGPPPPGVVVAWDRVPVEALQALIGNLGDGQPLGTLLARFGPEARVAADRALTTALIRGQGPRVAARALQQAVEGMGRNRALSVARTETLRAYRAASIANYAQNDVVIGWRWLAAHGKRTCLACLGRDGQVFEKSKPFPAHTNCRCTTTPVCRSWESLGYPGIPEPAQPETGADWFARQSEATQRAMLPVGAWGPFQRGEIALSDFIEEGSNRWGAYTVQRPLYAVLRGIEAVAADD